MSSFTRTRHFVCGCITSAVMLHAQTSSPPPIPKGAQASIRTLDAIQSNQSEVGQAYRCTLDAPIIAEGREIAAKGSDCVLRIVEKKAAGKLSGKNQLQLVLAAIRVAGSLVSVDSEPSSVTGKNKAKSSGIRTGIGAAIGAGVGGVLGGSRGAAIGAGAGAAGGVASAILTEGPEVKVPAETPLTFVIR